MTTKRLFISYRRSDSAPHALALRAEFERRLNSVYVFLDTQKIDIGSQWPAKLQEELFQCDALIALIGPDWLNAQNEAGQLRLFDNDDWVRRELAYALQHKPRHVLPVLVDGASPPQSGQLPSDLKALSDIQPLKVETEHWDTAVAKVLAWLGDAHGFALREETFAYPRKDDFVATTPSVAPQRLSQALATPQMAGWTVEGTDLPSEPDRVWLTRSYRFKSFATAMQFMNEMAGYCDTVRHHPRWENVHSEVKVRLSTFDAGFRITELDLSMAVQMNKVAERVTGT